MFRKGPSIAIEQPCCGVFLSESGRWQASTCAAKLGPIPCADDICRLLDLLPGERPARAGEGVKDAREKSWTSGGYAHGGIVGLRHNARAFPEATKAVLRHVKPRLKDAFGQVSFAALGIFCNIKAPLHADTGNAKGSLNYVLPLSKFSGGGLWVEQADGTSVLDSQGQEQKGVVLPVDSAPLAFDPSNRHCTQDWEGFRIARVSCNDAEYLDALGFQLDGGGPAPHASVLCAPSVAPTRTFGIHYSEVEFVREASRLGHPRSLCGALPWHIDTAVSALASHSHHEVALKRKQWLERWTKRASEIQANPDPAWRIADPAMGAILGCKRLQLLHEIIQAEGYADKHLAEDILHGFDLVGRCPPSAFRSLAREIGPASMHANDLRGCASKVQGALKASLGPSGDKDKDAELWEKTMAEVKEGWLEGPFEWDQLAPDEVPSHRFPLQQGSKLRPIDDYSLSRVNACVTTVESPTVDIVDVAAAMAAKMCWALKDKGRPLQAVGSIL